MGEDNKDSAQLKLVENMVNTPDDQLSSMTNIQPNLVTPLAMTETYEKLMDILKYYVKRYDKWIKKHLDHLEKIKARDYAKAEQDKDFICSLCVADGVEEREAKYKGKEAYKINFKGVWSKGIKGPQNYTEVDDKTPLCFDHAIGMVERIEWGPDVTEEEMKKMDEEDAKMSVQLTRVYRLSLYKHRRSVGGIHRMAMVDLAKEQMALESQVAEEGAPDYED